MAIGDIKINVIDVGQGQCTFVEIYDTGMVPRLIHTLLFDCGSDKTSPATYTNLNYVVNKALEKDPPGFDAIFFSHSDSDHISLAYYVLQTIIDECQETIQPEVGEVWYGGNYNLYTKGKSKFNILKYIRYSHLCDDTDNIKGFNANYTSYDTGTKNYASTLWETYNKELSVYALVANIISYEPDWSESILDFETRSAESKNRVSLVSGLYFGGTSYMICGDATNGTMAACNWLLKDGTAVLDNNSMTTLPHHGSRTTGLAVSSGKKASATSVATVQTFAANLKSKTITISAFQKHSHPSLQLMNEFIPTITTPLIKDSRLKEVNAHRVTANVDIVLTDSKSNTATRDKDYTFETLTNTFATNYSLSSSSFSYNLGTSTTVSDSQGVKDDVGSINEHACWQYAVASTGSFSMIGFADMSSVSFTEAATTFGTFVPEERILPLVESPAFTVRKKANVRASALAITVPMHMQSRIIQFI